VDSAETVTIPAVTDDRPLTTDNHAADEAAADDEAARRRGRHRAELDAAAAPALRRRQAVENSPGPGRPPLLANATVEAVPRDDAPGSSDAHLSAEAPNSAEAPFLADEPAKRRTHSRRRSILIRSAIVVVVAAVVAILLRAFVVQPYYIPSESMEPTLHGCSGCSEDHVLVDKVTYRFASIKAGDIVVFNRPKNADVADKVLIKRVVATAGQKVQLRRDASGQWDGKVYVNGLSLEEGYVNKKCGARPTLPLTSTTTWVIPKDHVFVMGDNRCDSIDSRTFGPITDSSVIGRAFLIIWPLSRFGGI